MILPKISPEQNNIIELLKLNNNVVVDSVAGSGKTTSNLHIAKYFSDKNILLITYNTKLKLETKEKIKKLGIKNMNVFTYHSFCVRYYNKKCQTDTVIRNILKKNKPPLSQINYDLFVFDEAQDITSLYYQLICKIYKDNEIKNAKICIFGDKYQSIFDFNNADKRFIEYAHILFDFNEYPWSQCKLSTSFRITHEMSLFINKCLLKNDRIVSNKISNNLPRYIICNCFNDYNDDTLRSFDEVVYYLGLGYKPSDIFILSPSVKGDNSPVRLLENKIKKTLSNVMVYVPTNDDEKIDETLLQDKLIFSTFHQAKGLERKVIIIFNFDNSYFEYYKKNADAYVFSNELYVATTRGIEQLTILHHYQNDYFYFIKPYEIQKYCYFEYKKLNIREKDNELTNYKTTVTELLKYLPQNIIDECYDKLEIIQNNEYEKSQINIPLQITNDETIESISEITGIAIPSMFELLLNNEMNIYDCLMNNEFEDNLTNCKNKNKNLFTKTIKPEKKYNLYDIDIQNLKPDELLYISNCWNTYKNGYLFKLYQITNYDWLEQNKLDECMTRFRNLNISSNTVFEYKILIENEPELLNRKIIGYVDCVDIQNNILYEFKCVQLLKKEHYLQLALYMYMFETKKEYVNKNVNEITKYVLFNILTNEYMEIKCSNENLKKIVELLIYTKYIGNVTITDEKFMEINMNIYSSYFT